VLRAVINATVRYKGIYMKRFVVAALVVMSSAMGCTYHSAIAQGPSPDKVFVTKTTSYIVWSVNKMELCSWSGAKATNCTDVTEE
jgi:Na+-translocating ferredoxin:NAD+ oxidoreductase RnfA subunit